MTIDATLKGMKIKSATAKSSQIVNCRKWSSLLRVENLAPSDIINEVYDIDKAYHSNTNKGTGFFKPSEQVLISR